MKTEYLCIINCLEVQSRQEYSTVTGVKQILNTVQYCTAGQYVTTKLILCVDLFVLVVVSIHVFIDVIIYNCLLM